MADTSRRLAGACAALLAATVTVACDSQAQFAPSLPPAAGFRVDDGVLKLWTGTPCRGVTGLTVIFDTGTTRSAKQVWSAPAPGVPLERMDLLGTAGGSAQEGAGGLRVEEPLPAGYDWTRADAINVNIDGPTAQGARVDVGKVLTESARHPAESYLFGQAGWMDAAQVRQENRTSFLTVCTPDPE